MKRGCQWPLSTPGSRISRGSTTQDQGGLLAQGVCEIAQVLGGHAQVLEHYLEVEIDEVMEKGIRILSVGRLDRLPPSTREAVEKAVALTRDNREMTLVFALSYGGRAEIVDAARKLMRDAEMGKIAPEDLDEKSFAAYLYAPEVPDPDLLIRTGAESRVSNFLLWQIAYSELFITDVMWPDFRKGNLVEAIVDYQQRERRFGMTSEQVRGGQRGAG